jgi:hypothetical protein
MQRIEVSKDGVEVAVINFYGPRMELQSDATAKMHDQQEPVRQEIVQVRCQRK